ncbi:MAG: acylphosphatase [bacterium]
MIALILNIKGKVQGVGMRYFIRKRAIELGISGYAKNLADGSVEALLIGDQQKIQILIDKIKNESPGYVLSLSSKEAEVLNEYIGNFEIL